MTQPDDSEEPGEETALAEATELSAPPAWPSDLEKLQAELETALQSKERQGFWWALGTTPAAILPIMVALAYDLDVLAGIFLALAIVIQSYRWYASKKKVDALRDDIERARAEAKKLAPDPDGADAELLPGRSPEHGDGEPTT